MTPPALAAALCTSMECTPGLTNIDARLADLDIEGVEKELIFPQRLFGLFMFGKMMNRAETFAAYNEADRRDLRGRQGPALPGDGAELLGPGAGQGSRRTLPGNWARTA